MKRGTFYWVNLEPADPPEFGKVRPALIVSNTEQNIRLPTVIVVPLSSRAPEIWPLRIACQTSGKKESFAVIPGLRQISKERLKGVIGTAPSSLMDRVDEALQIYLRD